MLVASATIFFVAGELLVTETLFAEQHMLDI
jgi:hypothetical protein